MSANRIGPQCTIGAHNQAVGTCPNMQQPSAPGPRPLRTHTWAPSFVVDWEFVFVHREDDAPPYLPHPRTPFNITRGRTWYSTSGSALMRESYETYCIPVFAEGVMAMRNDFACDFINVDNASFVITHEDRPIGVPPCCIIGEPFHPPPRNFHTRMPRHWRSKVGDVQVDWGAVWDKEAGIFAYGFEGKSVDVPFAFYMKGVPWMAAWMWQRFQNFERVEPDPAVWELPKTCEIARPCPGWEAASNSNAALGSGGLLQSGVDEGYSVAFI